MDNEADYLIMGQTFTKREQRLVDNCIEYEEGDPAGLPGHNLMILVAKLAKVAGLKDMYDFAMSSED
jgi:hypothetical protein